VIVTCERCTTQFQLDDAKIPENGIQVQCSRCEHVFAVARETLPDADNPEDLAVDALLSGSSDDFDNEADDLLADDAGGDGESDWEFNDDGVIGDSFGSEEPAEDTVEPAGEMSIAEEAVDDLLANVDDMVSLDESALDDAEPEAEDPLGGFELEEPEPDSAEEESVVESPVIEPPPVESPVIEPPPVEAPVIESPPVEAPAIESPATASPVIEPPPVVDVSEELGDLDNWDIFDEPSGAASDAASPGPAEQTLAPSSGAASAETGAHLEPAVDISVPLDTGDSKTSLWMTHARGIAGWAVVTVLLLIGFQGSLAGHSDAVRGSAGHWAGGGFEAEQIEGRWVDNGVAGPIYVVSGRLRRVAGSANHPGARLEIRLVNAKGRTLDWGPASVGPEIPNRMLHESNPSQLDSRQSRRAVRLAAGAEDWRTFEAVLAGVPDSAERFELEVSGAPAG
jgi:predicted Zn finger-like uncharacterized protein